MQTSPRVLLVETDESVALRLRTALAGADCKQIHSLPAARERLAELPPDALLVDLAQPGLVEMVPGLTQSADAPALLVHSEAPDETLGDAAIAAGAQAYLVLSELTPAGLRRALRHAVERNRSRRALRTRMNVLHSILTTIPEAVLVVAPDGSVRLCNPAARTLLDFGSTPEAASGPLRAEVALLERAAAGETVDELSVVCPGNAGGEGRSFAATLRPLRAADTEVGGLIVLRDETRNREVEARVQALNEDLARGLTERTEALRLAEEANRLKTKFLEAVSHELRTPLTPILGFARLLLRRPTQELCPEDQETLELIYDNANRLLRVVDSMLDFQALQRHALSLDPAPTAVPSLLKDLAQAARASVAGAPVDVWLDIAPQVPDILLCDGRRLAQILHRLIENAVAHTPRGEVRIAASWDRVQKHLRVCVRDTGAGIAPEHQARIFLAFYQVEPGTGPGHGVGLGLPYAQLLANAMGGTIQVQSTPGQGAEFTVDVPAPAIEAEARLPHGVP